MLLALSIQVFLALDQHVQLLGNLTQPSQHHLIPIRKPKNRVPDPDLLAKLFHKLLSRSQIMPWHSGEQMVHGLEL